MKTPGYKAFRKGSFLFCGGGEQSPATCHSAVRVPSYIPLRMQGSPLNPVCGGESELSVPIWSDVGPGGSKNELLFLPSAGKEKN